MEISGDGKMKYCFIQKEKVYGCDHHRCHNNGSTINGMIWCRVQNCHVYGCDHYECQ